MEYFLFVYQPGDVAGIRDPLLLKFTGNFLARRDMTSPLLPFTTCAAALRPDRTRHATTVRRASLKDNY